MSGGSVRPRKSAICGRPAASSDQLSCAPAALHCSAQPIASAPTTHCTQLRRLSGTGPVQA